MRANITVPPLTLVVSRLKELSQAELRQLAKDSGVPFQTLINIRYGVTKNPGIETVRQFFPLLASGDSAPAIAQQE